MRPCVRAFEYHGDACKQRNHILAKVCQCIKQPTRLYFAPNVDAKNAAEMPRKLPFMWCYILVKMLAQSVHV